MAKHSETERTHEEEIQNDDVVGKALKWSAMFLVLGAVVVGAALILTRKPDEVVQDVAPPTAIPQVRDRPQVEIPNIPFTEVTSAAGIGFRHQNGAAGEKLLP
ncbi:MAG: CRTAC1 family protein, partial [Planctomycetaceae bacterium]